MRAMVAAVAAAAPLALGAVALQPAGAAVADCVPEDAGIDDLKVSFNSNRSGATPLGTGALPTPMDGSAKPFFFLAVDADESVSEVKFWLDEIKDNIADCSLNPRIDRSTGTIHGDPDHEAYDFFGGNERKATAFSVSQLNAGLHRITALRTTGANLVYTVGYFDVG